YKLDSLPVSSNVLLTSPVENLAVCFRVLKLPKELEISPLASYEYASVSKFKLAPKAPEPLVEVPTPRCNCRFSTLETKSGIFTQKLPCDSASLYGIPLMVTLIRVPSLPRTRIPV